MNILYYVKKFEAREGGEIEGGELLNVLKYQRSILVGGLKRKDNVMGADCKQIVLKMHRDSQEELKKAEVEVEEQNLK